MLKFLNISQFKKKGSFDAMQKKMLKKTIIFFVIISLCTLFLWACGNNKNVATPDEIVSENTLNSTIPIIPTESEYPTDESICTTNTAPPIEPTITLPPEEIKPTETGCQTETTPIETVATTGDNKDKESSQSASSNNSKPSNTKKPSRKPSTTNPDSYILKQGQGFYQGSLRGNKITSITFSRTAPSKYDECWSANITDTNEITGYRIGTKVFIVGKKIRLNPDSKGMFCHTSPFSSDLYQSPIGWWGSLEEIHGLELLDTSAAQDMSYMFYDGPYKILNIGNWDLSNVKTTKMMFAYCTNLEYLDVDNWDVGNVADFSLMFSGHSWEGDMKLKQLDVSNWDTSSATNMSSMFYGCAQLELIDISNWDVSNVTTFSHMFADCYNVKHLDISKWKTLSVESFDAIFNDCHSLTTIDVSNLPTGTCRQFSQMFESCFNLVEIKGIETLDVSNADTAAFAEMFYCCYALKSLNLSKWNTTKADNLDRMFCRCKSLTELDLSNFDISNVVTMEEIFDHCPDDLVVNGISSWNLTNVAQ